VDARTVRELCRYNQWADGQVLEVAATLTPADLTRRVGGSFGSVHATLTHILWAERLWLERWRAGASVAPFEPQAFASVGALRRTWERIAEEQSAFLDSLGDDQLARPASYVNQKGETWTYPLWQQVYHAFSHSAYHRGQVAVLFRQLGARPVTTDFLNFRDASNRAPGSRRP